jgi:TonB family protein
MPIRFPRNFFSRILLATVSVSIAAAAAFAQAPQVQQLSPMEELAEKAASAIAQDSKDELVKRKVLVVNFLEEGRKPTELSSKFADEFADSLRKNGPNLVVIDRDDYFRAAAQDKIPADIVPDEGVSKCYGAQLDADYITMGSLEYTADMVVVGISVIRNEGHKKIFDKATSLPLTPEIQASVARPASAPDVSPPPSSDKTHLPSAGRSSGVGELAGVPMPGTKGYTMPTWLNCPRAEYTPAGVKAKIQGTVLLNVQIGPSGTAENISIIHGLHCGMNQASIDSVSQWKFNPADGPDGNPAAVTVPIEVWFRIY